MPIERSDRFYMVHALLNAIASIRVEGQSNIPLTGGAIIVCNHTDPIDAVIQGLYSRRELSFLAKSELVNEGWLDQLHQWRRDASKMGLPAEILAFVEDGIDLGSQLLDDVQILPIIRGYRAKNAGASLDYYRQLQRRLKRYLREGRVIAIYPEGRRSDDGSIARFRGFAARVALDAGVPVVPTAILGAQGFSDLNRWVRGDNRDKTITYRIGKAVYPEAVETITGKRAIKVLTHQIESVVRSMARDSSNGFNDLIYRSPSTPRRSRDGTSRRAESRRSTSITEPGLPASSTTRA